MLWNQNYGVAAWNPWREMQRLQSEMNRIYHEVDRPASPEVPPITVWSGENGLKVGAQVPGFAPKEIEVTVVGDMLTIKGRRESREKVDGESWHRAERASSGFVRTMQLPYSIEADQVKAGFENGVLEIELPRKASEKPRKIPVSAR